MRKEQRSIPQADSLTCPDCKSKRFRVSYNKVECTECGWFEKKASNKYGAKKQIAKDGIKRDSMYEADVANELLLRKRVKDIKDYDTQYKVEMWAHRPDGTAAFKVQHKVDFRIHHNDGSYELLEAKGVETEDYKWRRRFLENIWLPEHLDHTYTVVKQARRYR